MNIAVIVIGRNEGQRLRVCLESVLGRGQRVVYVDSGSTDGSAELARSMGAEVVELDSAVPFSAARARNRGADRLLLLVPGVQYIQFIDGDCELRPGWLETAWRTLEERREVAVVCGRRRERSPEASVYNRLADLEWDRPPGEVESCGGDAMFRASAFFAVRGFDPSITAGEEPELCRRLREKRWKVLRIDAEMTVHDAATTSFDQWWRRQVRSGYGALDVMTRFGHGSDQLFAKQVRSARLWTIGYARWVLAAFALTFTLIMLLAPVESPLALAIAGAFLWATIVAMVWPLQALRLALQVRPRVDGWRTAIAYGVLTLTGKWANLAGQRRYVRDRASGRAAAQIEYKAERSHAAAPAAGTT